MFSQFLQYFCNHWIFADKIVIRKYFHIFVSEMILAGVGDLSYDH